MSEDVELAGQLSDGTPCNLKIENSVISLKIDYVNPDPSTFFDAPDFPESLTVILSNGKIAELKHVYMISSHGTMGHGRTIKAGANLAIIGDESFSDERNVDIQ